MPTSHPVTDYESVLVDGAQFVDVREPDEVATGTLPGTVNIPLGALADRLDELDPTHRVVVLCKSGGRSAQACETLEAAAFTDVVNLDGGMLAWNKATKRAAGRRSIRSRFGR